MKARITNESKDNNPSPLEELGNELLYSDEHRTVYVKHLKSFGEIKQALTNYANMVEMLNKLLDTYDTFPSSEINIGRVCREINQVLEGKV